MKNRWPFAKYTVNCATSDRLAEARDEQSKSEVLSLQYKARAEDCALASKQYEERAAHWRAIIESINQYLKEINHE